MVPFFGSIRGPGSVCMLEAGMVMVTACNQPSAKGSGTSQRFNTRSSPTGRFCCMAACAVNARRHLPDWWSESLAMGSASRAPTYTSSAFLLPMTVQTLDLAPAAVPRAHLRVPPAGRICGSGTGCFIRSSVSGINLWRPRVLIGRTDLALSRTRTELVINVSAFMTEAECNCKEFDVEVTIVRHELVFEYLGPKQILAIELDPVLSIAASAFRGLVHFERT